MSETDTRADRRQKIIAATLTQADEVGWEAVRLHRVAATLGLSLAELSAEFRDQDAIAEAWLAQADRAMLAPPEEGFRDLPPPERIEWVLWRWLDALAPHKRVTGQILLGKLYPGHPHFVAALVFRLSRTVQWLREAALLEAPPPRRQIEEIGLTWLFVATVARWATDTSPGQARTRAFLKARLREADRLLGACRRRAASLDPPMASAT